MGDGAPFGKYQREHLRDAIPLLFDAAAHGRTDQMHALLLAGVDPMATDTDGSNPLHFVGSSRAAKLLIEFGASVNAKNKWGSTPLHQAAAKGRTKTVDLLISENAAPNSPNQFGHTALHAAANGGCCRALLRGKAVVNVRAQGGITPLHLVKTKDQVEALCEYFAEVNGLDNEGNTPLHAAALNYHYEAAEALIEKGANVFLRNVNKKTPLQVATMKGKPDMIELLAKHTQSQRDKDRAEKAKIAAMQAAVRAGGASGGRTVSFGGAAGSPPAGSAAAAAASLAEAQYNAERAAAAAASADADLTTQEAMGRAGTAQEDRFGQLALMREVNASKRRIAEVQTEAVRVAQARGATEEEAAAEGRAAAAAASADLAATQAGVPPAAGGAGLAAPGEAAGAGATDVKLDEERVAAAFAKSLDIFRGHSVQVKAGASRFGEFGKREERPASAMMTRMRRRVRYIAAKEGMTIAEGRGVFTPRGTLMDAGHQHKAPWSDFAARRVNPKRSASVCSDSTGVSWPEDEAGEGLNSSVNAAIAIAIRDRNAALSRLQIASSELWAQRRRGDLAEARQLEAEKGRKEAEYERGVLREENAKLKRELMSYKGRLQALGQLR